MGYHHENDIPACQLCELKLTLADPYLQDWFRTKKISYPTLHISWSYRGQVDQEAAFNSGASLLHYPNSAHNFTVLNIPRSLALDLFSLTEAGIAVFPYPLYVKIAAENASDRLPMKWGGDFKSLGDAGHFQYTPPVIQ